MSSYDFSTRSHQLFAHLAIRIIAISLLILRPVGSASNELVASPLHERIELAQRPVPIQPRPIPMPVPIPVPPAPRPTPMPLPFPMPVPVPELRFPIRVPVPELPLPRAPVVTPTPAQQPDERGKWEITADYILQKLPKQFDTYTLLLFPDPAWADKEAIPDRLEIERRFEQYGHLIGSRHAAVWFIGLTAEDPDVLASQMVAARFGLSFLKGPYLVFFQGHPADMLTDEAIVVSLSDLDAKAIRRLLTLMNEDLRTLGTVTVAHVRRQQWVEWLTVFWHRHKEDLFKLGNLYFEIRKAK